MRLQSENCRDARNTVATSTAPAFRRYTTRYRPTMISGCRERLVRGRRDLIPEILSVVPPLPRVDEQSGRHTAVNRGRCTRESLQDPETLAATRSAPSHAKPTFDLVVWDALASIEFLESSLDFGEKHQALDRIVNGGVRRKLPQSLDHAITRICGRHIDFYCNADQFRSRIADSVSWLRIVGPTCCCPADRPATATKRLAAIALLVGEAGLGCGESARLTRSGSPRHHENIGISERAECVRRMRRR